MDFREAQEEVAKVESKSLGYETPSGPAPQKLRQALTVSPPSITQMSYLEALAGYNRIEKVIGASRFEELLLPEGEKPAEEMPAPEAMPAPEEAKPPEKKELPKPEKEIPAPEKEEKEAIPKKEEAPVPRKREEPEFEEIPEEEEPAMPAVPPKAPEVKKELPVEFEEIEEEAEKPKEAKPEFEIEFEKPGGETAAPPAAPPPPPPSEEKAETRPIEPKPSPGVAFPPVEIPIPPELSASPEEAAAKTMGRLRAQYGAKKGRRPAAADKTEVKKRMLELTRELFKEKSVGRREELKKEIVSLKNMLSAPGGGRAKKADFAGILEKEQEYELSEAKKGIENAYQSSLVPLKSTLAEQVALGKAEQAYPQFSQRLGELKGQLQALTQSYQSYLLKKHSAELEALVPESKSAKLRKRLSSIQADYAEAFSGMGEALDSQMASLLAKQEALGKGRLDEKTRKVMEISEKTDEELLIALQKEDPRMYAKYSRGELSRLEALSNARRTLAKKAGLPASVINKYFGGKNK